MIARLLITVALLLLGSASVGAQSSVRVALVIANSGYKNTPALRNPVNDGRDVADELRSLGFSVTFVPDADKRATDRAIVQFSRAAGEAEAAIFYYAGHGMQFEGKNYLLPVDAELEDQISLRYEATNLDDVKAALQNTKAVKILILDACRNNPLAERFTRSFQGSSRALNQSRGLAPIERTGGMVVVYATQSNETAQDGDGRNSPFSHALLTQLKVPGLETSTLFRRVSTEVYNETHGAQEPEISISSFPDFFINQSETDASAWVRLRDTADRQKLEHFIAQFPDSFYVPEAKLRIDYLDQRGREAEETEARMRSEAARTAAEQGKRDAALQAAAARERELEAEVERLQKASSEAKDADAKLASAQAEASRLNDVQASAKRLSDQLSAEEANHQRTAQQVDALQRDRLARERANEQLQAEVDSAKQAAEQARREKELRDEELKQAGVREKTLEEEVAKLKAVASVKLHDKPVNPVQASLAEPPASSPASVDAGLTSGSEASSRANPATLLPEIRAELRRIGCYKGRDADWTAPPMQAALLSLREHGGLSVLPSQPSDTLLAALRLDRQGRCPSPCGPGTTEKNGVCVAKLIAPKFQRSTVSSSAVRHVHPVAINRSPAVLSGSGKCFSFGGKQYCE